MRKTATTAEGGTLPSRGEKNTMKKKKSATLAVKATATTGKTSEEVAGVEDNASGREDGDDDDSSLDGVRDQLSGVDLLEACDRLENDNLRLRQRIAKLDLQKMQKEHGEDNEEEHNDDSQLTPVMVDSTLSCVIIRPRLYVISSATVS